MILYEEDRSLYLNLTNRCPVSCRFCVKTSWDYQFKGRDLRIQGSEPSVEDLLDALKERLKTPGLWREVVFCGFGECVYRLAEMSAVGLHLKLHHPELNLRLNTVGLGNLIWGRDIAPELALYLDEICVSLNTSEPRQWLDLHRPAPAYRKTGFEASRRFAERCVAAGIRTRVTAVELPDVDLRPLMQYARTIGADFRARPVLA
jgi:TatD family-associated radical SAM protein